MALDDAEDGNNSDVDLVFDKCVFAFVGSKDLAPTREKVEKNGGIVSPKINSRVRFATNALGVTRALSRRSRTLSFLTEIQPTTPS
jgi:hypothetical protein